MKRDLAKKLMFRLVIWPSALVGTVFLGHAAYSAKLERDAAKPAYMRQNPKEDRLYSGDNADFIRCFHSIKSYSQTIATGGAATWGSTLFIPGERAQTRGLFAFTQSKAWYFPFPEEQFHFAELVSPSGERVYVGFAETGPSEYQLTVRDHLLPENEGRVKKVDPIESMDLEARAAFRKLLRLAVQKAFYSFDSRARLAKSDPKFIEMPDANDYIRALKSCQTVQDGLLRESVRAEISKLTAVAAKTP